MKNRLFDPIIRYLIRGVHTYAITVGQTEELIATTHSLSIEVERVMDNDFPNGTRLLFHIEGCNKEYLKDGFGNFVIGDGYWDEETWVPRVFVRNETIKDIRDSLRLYWQGNKDAEGPAFVSIAVTEDPKDIKKGTGILIKKVVFKIPVAEGQRFGRRAISEA